MKVTYDLKVAVIAVFLVAMPFAVSAESVVRSGETVSVDSDQRIDGDFYTAASIINLSGEVSEDMSALGGKVTLNGNVGKDALLLGGNVDVHGSVGDDLRVIGGDVILAEPVTGDVFVIARSLTVLDTASIGGDLVVYASEVEVSGSIGGDVAGQIETFRLDAPVKGGVDVSVIDFVLGDRTDVAGTVRYTSTNTVTRAPSAKIAGELTRSDNPEKTEDGVTAKAVAIPVLMLLFSALVWYLVARKFLTVIVERALVRTIRPTATGFITFFAAPAVIIILTVSVLGTLVGVTAFVAYLFAILLAIVSSAAVLGQFLLQLYTKKSEPLAPLTLLFGVAGIVALAIIPVLGVVLLFFLFLITLGALVDVVLHPVPVV